MRTRALALALLTIPALALAAASPENKCEAKQHRVVAKHSACRHKAEAKAIKKGIAPVYTKCDAKFAKKWPKTLAGAVKKGTTCRYDDDGSALQTFVEDRIDTVTTTLDGTGLPSCGDAAINLAGEQCDGAALGGEDCAGLGFASGTLACDGACTFDTSSCVATCLGGSTNCSGTCVLLDSDNLNCGTCGTPCGPGTRCELGGCI